ncbi:uncharacterized protein LOC121877386 [Homarus americanus]|uniref:uncharacterized protein LOC121877386 n=1 Tax=Homarus americanus TaxID=6706 RepID=UPI001C469133|nr:uncharacterized protein LOC121877386 [Homarus americanus]
MEAEAAERSVSSPSGSEEMESDGEIKHEDEVDNGKDSDEENDKEEAEDSDSDESDPTGEEGSENSVKSDDIKNSEDKKNTKDCEASVNDHDVYVMDGECYPMADLPLEVITTVEPTNYSYPVLKNMSNGVLTHRNIFTEHERSVLVNIINKYRNIVDTRSRTREIYLEKQSVWQQIVEEYNSTENIMVRTEKELRKCWDNMKYRAKQAEKEMFKVLDGVQVKAEASEFEVKMEPLDQYDQRSPSDDEEDSTEPSGGGGGGGGAGDDDREPALKRARQESPKLSSLLLAAANKRSPSRKVNGSKNGGVTTNKNSSSGSFPYNIPACTKVLHVKKKAHPFSPTVTVNTTSASEIPILPKGLASCLSITNIPNPVSATNHISGNFGSHMRDSVSPSSSPIQGSIKPMPSLKKMVPNKHQTSSLNKNSNLRGSRKSGTLSSKMRGRNSVPSHSSRIIIENGSGRQLLFCHCWTP